MGSSGTSRLTLLIAGCCMIAIGIAIVRGADATAASARKEFFGRDASEDESLDVIGMRGGHDAFGLRSGTYGFLGGFLAIGGVLVLLGFVSTLWTRR